MNSAGRAGVNGSEGPVLAMGAPAVVRTPSIDPGCQTPSLRVIDNWVSKGYLP